MDSLRRVNRQLTTASYPRHLLYACFRWYYDYLVIEVEACVILDEGIITALIT